MPGLSDSNRECQGTAHMKRQQSLTEEEREREFYLVQMLDEKTCSKEKTQGRKREGSMRGMELLEKSDETSKEVSDLI